MNDPSSGRARELLQRLQSDPASVVTNESLLVPTGQVIATELRRLTSHVDKAIDPIVKIVGALVAGFHGIEPEAGWETSDLFRMGAEQRARLDRLEDDVKRVSDMVDRLETSLKRDDQPDASVPLPAPETAARRSRSSRARRGLPEESFGCGRDAGDARDASDASDARDAGDAGSRAAKVPPGAPTDEYQSAFWTSYLGVGFFTQLLAILVIEGYLEAVHYHLHRSFVFGALAVALAATVVGLFNARRIADSRWRSQTSTIWCLASITGIGVFAYLDGGINSPLLYLLALPVLYATVALQVGEVRSCVLAAIFQPVWVALINPKLTGPFGAVMVLCGVVLGVSVLAVVLTGYRSRLQDQQRILTQQLHVRSVTDGLTGCVTSQVFHQRLNEELIRATRDGRQLSVMICDVDRFKSFNDTHGHLAGDGMLVRVSSAIMSTVRSSDYVGRVGGDEFAILLPDTSPTDAYVVAGRVMAKIVRGPSPSASVSIGVAALDEDVASPAQLFEMADGALYEAKNRGGGAVHCFDGTKTNA